MSKLRVTFTGISWAAIQWQNVVAFDNPDGTYSLPVAAAELRDNWCTLLAAGMTTQAGFRNISVYEIGSGTTPFNLPVVVNGIDAVDPGTGTQVVCQKFRIHTGVPGRRGRGRIYLAGYRANLWTNGQLNATGITNMTIRLNAISARYVTAGHPSNLHLGVCPRGDDPTLYKSAEFISLSLTPGIQRRRNIGVGI